MTLPSYLVRNLSHLVVSGRDCLAFCGGDQQALLLSVQAPANWSDLLQDLIQPQATSEVLTAASCPAELDATCLGRLLEAGHLLGAETPSQLEHNKREALTKAPALHLSAGEQRCRHLLVGVTGSIVAGLMAQTLLSLRFSGFQEQLDVILTSTAGRFLSRDLLEAYGLRCWQDSFEQQDGIRVPHVALAAGADLICVLPASADSLDRIARSSCRDLLSLTITASLAPVLVAPVMNGTMWNNPGVQRNVQQLREDGRFILEPSMIFGAADFGRDAPPMYGGHGCLWSGPAGLLQALSAVQQMRARSG